MPTKPRPNQNKLHDLKVGREPPVEKRCFKRRPLFWPLSLVSTVVALRHVTANDAARRRDGGQRGSEESCRSSQSPGAPGAPQKGTNRSALKMSSHPSAVTSGT